MKKFAFLIHPRISAKEDLGRIHPLFRIFPERVLRLIGEYLPSIAKGKVTFNRDNETKGWIIVVPLTGGQFFSLKKSFVINKIVKAIEKAKKLGAEVVGLGEFTASITHGGEDLVGRVENVWLTNGNSLTAGVTIKAIEKISKIKKIDLTKDKIAIVGGGGSIGKGVSLFFAEKNFPLIIVEKKEKIEKLKSSFLSFPSVTITNHLSSLKEAKLIIVVTSSTEQIIKPEYLEEGTVIYDITQPRNTSPDILKIRKDITVIDGGIIDTSEIDYGMDIGLKRHQTYACLAETIICALEEIEENYVGYTNIEIIKKMLNLVEKYQNYFKLNIFRSFGRPLNNKLELI